MLHIISKPTVPQGSLVRGDIREFFGQRPALQANWRMDSLTDYSGNGRSLTKHATITPLSDKAGMNYKIPRVPGVALSRASFDLGQKKTAIVWYQPYAIVMGYPDGYHALINKTTSPGLSEILLYLNPGGICTSLGYGSSPLRTAFAPKPAKPNMFNLCACTFDDNGGAVTYCNDSMGVQKVAHSNIPTNSLTWYLGYRPPDLFVNGQMMHAGLFSEVIPPSMMFEYYRWSTDTREKSKFFISSIIGGYTVLHRMQRQRRAA